MSDAPYSVPVSPRRRNRLLTALAVAAAAAVIAAVVGRGVVSSYLAGRAEQSRECAPGVERVGPANECVGVTDGAYTFTTNLRDVEARIHEENAAIARLQHVSIAYLIPMTVTSTEPTTPDVVRHQVEGAYIAQVRANGTRAQGDYPLVRLLLANTGSQGQQWKPVVEDLVRRVGTDDHLVAVAGLGLSLDTTRQVVAFLHLHQIPMVGAVFTADNLGSLPDGTRMNELVRVAPTNSDEARAAIAYARGTSVRTALLVRDDNASDLYANNLAEAFQGLAGRDGPPLVGRGVERFRADLQGVGTTFYQMRPAICAARPQMIYFAGRALDLQTFTETMADRECPDLPINIFSGDTANNLAQTLSRSSPAQERLRAALGKGIEITYTGLAHPHEWDGATGDAKVDAQNFDAFRVRFQSAFRDDTLDWEAMMGHDAVLTAVTAIRKIAPAYGGPADAAVTTQEMVQEWNRLDTVIVQGAAGRVSFDENNPTNKGNPISRPIPILRLNADGSTVVVQVTRPAA